MLSGVHMMLRLHLNTCNLPRGNLLTLIHVLAVNHPLHCLHAVLEAAPVSRPDAVVLAVEAPLSSAASDHAGALQAGQPRGLVKAEDCLPGRHQPQAKVAVAVDSIARTQDTHLEIFKSCYKTKYLKHALRMLEDI